MPGVHLDIARAAAARREFGAWRYNSSVPLAFSRRIMGSTCDFLAPQDPLAPCDLIFVMAGLLERKAYGLQLFQQGLAPRLILSVGRFEIRATSALTSKAADLSSLRDGTEPRRRHFWLDLHGAYQHIAVADLRRSGTFSELLAVAAYLAHNPPTSLALVSTSIHLRRVRYCCSRIPFFQQRKVYLWAVPEPESSFHRDGWWKSGRDRRYLCSEYLKLAGYHLLY